MAYPKQIKTAVTIKEIPVKESDESAPKVLYHSFFYCLFCKLIRIEVRANFCRNRPDVWHHSVFFSLNLVCLKYYLSVKAFA